MSACPVCAVYRSQHEPHLPRWPSTCDWCRSRLAADLAQLPDLYALLPSVLAPASSGESTKVSGSREAPVPPNLDVVDLLLPARPAAAGVRMRFDPAGFPGVRPLDPPIPVNWASQGGDPLQVGHLSVATVLDFWVRDWRETRHRGEGLPAPTVVTLAGWLSGERLRWACDEHGAIDEFARDLRNLVTACRRHLSLARHIIRLPVPCPSPECDMVALFRESGGDYVECGACGRLWKPSEYERLAVVAAADLERFEEKRDVA